LAKVRWPGVDGAAGSLVEQIDIISSVSGGSLAAAYFALNRPAPANLTDAQLDHFFIQFSEAMATDLESVVLRQFLDPRHTLAFLTTCRPAAEAIAKNLDNLLGGTKSVKFSDVFDRMQAAHAPLLLINATDLSNTNPFVFTADKKLRPVFVTAPGRDDPSLARQGDNRHFIEPFGDRYGELSNYRVADAVAASAAYPILLQYVSLGDPSNFSKTRTLRLSDGGLVDNLGLLTCTHICWTPIFTDWLAGGCSALSLSPLTRKIEALPLECWLALTVYRHGVNPRFISL